jgi:putative endopeptidase
MTKALGALAAIIVSTMLAFANDAAPQYGKWGFDANGKDARTKPGDDFFRFANGTWLDKTPIPEDKPGYSLRLQMTDRTEARLHDMLQSLGKTGGHQPTALGRLHGRKARR